MNVAAMSFKDRLLAIKALRAVIATRKATDPGYMLTSLPYSQYLQRAERMNHSELVFEEQNSAYVQDKFLLDKLIASVLDEIIP